MARSLEGPDRPLPKADHRWVWTPSGAAPRPWYRIYHRDRYTADGISFRQFGPLHRFDHHTPPYLDPDVDPDGRAVLYIAEDIATGGCEVFGEVGIAPLCSNLNLSRGSRAGLSGFGLDTETVDPVCIHGRLPDTVG
ncbi:hypothetical protein EV641_106220 [Rhodococcus sp. SMB37]|uniref:hypothetical protein n=1 Tax=Rhodococcus sp. SMB37 TaxID=2512213 RepID=UPI001043D336|nr:hypothetical protein [Rhodococcus sp. SMB37]TCN53574.1 hypothetical protein EV641_106220 [Rhodococcus sp. SMB37]